MRMRVGVKGKFRVLDFAMDIRFPYLRVFYWVGFYTCGQRGEMRYAVNYSAGNVVQCVVHIYRSPAVITINDS